ncbi:MAG: hypothetical protein V1755_14125 [Chloroflexota bacterium]
MDLTSCLNVLRPRTWRAYQAQLMARKHLREWFRGLDCAYAPRNGRAGWSCSRCGAGEIAHWPLGRRFLAWWGF